MSKKKKAPHPPNSTQPKASGQPHERQAIDIGVFHKEGMVIFALGGQGITFLPEDARNLGCLLIAHAHGVLEDEAQEASPILHVPRIITPGKA